MIKRYCIPIVCIFLFYVSGKAYGQELMTIKKTLSHEQVQKVIQESQQNIQSILKKEIYLSGLAVTLVSRDEVLWSECFGYRDKLRNDKVDTNTMFGILSVSKTITVTGLMLAVQEGLIILDIPIKNYLPGFTIHSRFSEDPMSKITIRRLISMTSGLTHDAPIGNNADPFTPSYEAHIQSISQTWLRFQTGEREDYSNLGIELAAYCLEQVIQKPFAEYIQEKIFNPLGMERSTYGFERIKNDKNRAIGHNKNFESVPIENPYLAPGGVYSSITDMAKFIKFHLNLGRIIGHTIIKEEIIKQMQTIPSPVRDQITGYAQGLQVRYYHLGGEDVRCIEHGGGGFGFQCQMKWLPDLGYGVMVLTNSSDQDYGQERLVEDILLKIVELLTGKKNLGPSDWLNRHGPPKSVDSTYLPPNLVGRYNGTYYVMVCLIKDGRFGYASDNTFVPLTPISQFEYISNKYLYRFICDAGGTPVSVIRPYDGMVWNRGESNDEPKGLEKKEWKRFEGTYVRKRFGVTEKFYNVSIKNGWLHFIGSGQDFRLTEHLPGLFFTPDGEAVDFRSSTPTFRNIKLYKVCD